MDEFQTASSRVLGTSSSNNGAMSSTTLSNSSTTTKFLINPLQIGDPALRKMRTITTTPPIKSTPVIFLNTIPAIKSEREMIDTTGCSSNNGQTTMTLQALLQSLNQMGLLQTSNTLSTVNTQLKPVDTMLNSVSVVSTVQQCKSTIFFISNKTNELKLFSSECNVKQRKSE